MSKYFPFFPQQASVQAGQVDAIFFFMVAVTAFFSLLIAGLIIFFAIRYRRRRDEEIGVAIHGLVIQLLPRASALHGRLVERELRRL